MIAVLLSFPLSGSTIGLSKTELLNLVSGRHGRFPGSIAPANPNQRSPLIIQPAVLLVVGRRPLHAILRTVIADEIGGH